MPARAFRVLALAALMVGTAATRAYGWGDLGHSVVGEIAERLVKPETRVKLRAILAKRGMSLAEAATWPDQMRSDADFQNTTIASWHFVTLSPKTNLPVNNTHAIWAINLMTNILAGQEKPYEVPRKNPKKGNAIVIDDDEAVMFLAHFIGDIHQPLHVGNERDFGANACLVKWFGEVRRGEGFWNLHTVWDEGILEKLAIGRVDLANDLLQRLNKVSASTLLNANSAMGWAQESAAVRPSVYPQLTLGKNVDELSQPYCLNPNYENLPGKYAGAGEAANVIDAPKLDAVSAKLFADPVIPRLSYDYKSQHVELAKMQLLKAGVRLAYVLDLALANK